MSENKLYALNLADDGRILSATEDKYGAEGQPRVESLPTGETDKEKDISNWLYVDGQYKYDPLPDPPDPAKYTIYVYDTGEAQIEVDSVNQIVQTHEDLILDNMILKAGTVILPGDGNKIYYEYPRHDNVTN